MFCFLKGKAQEHHVWCASVRANLCLEHIAHLLCAVVDGARGEIHQEVLVVLCDACHRIVGVTTIESQCIFVACLVAESNILCECVEEWSGRTHAIELACKSLVRQFLDEVAEFLVLYIFGQEVYREVGDSICTISWCDGDGSLDAILVNVVLCVLWEENAAVARASNLLHHCV